MQTYVRLGVVLLAIMSTEFLHTPDSRGQPGDVPQVKSTFTASRPHHVVGFDQSASRMRTILERYAVDRNALSRANRIPMSRTFRERMRRFYADWAKSMDAVNFQSLTRDGQIDFLLLKNQLRYELRQLDYREKRNSQIMEFVPFWDDVVGLEESRRRFEPVQPAKTAGKLADLMRELAELHEAVKTKQLKANSAVASRAASRVEDLRNTLTSWYRFYQGYDPVFTWWIKNPFETVDRDLQRYRSAIREHLVGLDSDNDEAVIGDPIGREALLEELDYEMIAYTPEELLEIAENEFTWCEAEMRKASSDLGYGDDWRKALEHVKTLHVQPGRQPELIRDLAREVEEFLDERDLVTIPELCRETWRMEMMSPARQKVNPYFTGGEVIRVSFPTDGMTHEQKLMSMRGNNLHFARATVHHELIPGHHLQGFMASRYRTHRRPFRTPFLVEGWALYWEMLLWDLGLAQSPEDRVGMLFWRMHRCARIMFSLRFHLEKMTAQEAIDFLIRRVGHERNNAVAEVRRSVQGNYGPLYQAAYMLGGLQLRALYGELVKSGKMTHRQFHDAVLKENSIPVEMIRASLTHQPLTRDFRSSWRFYELRPGGASK